MTVRLGLLLGSMLVCSMSVFSTAWASAKESIKADPSEFPAHRARIEKALGDPERYSELTRTQREEITRALDRMERTLAGIESIASLEDKAKVQLINDQELVNTTLTKAAEDSRLICRQETVTGSHRARPRCMTLAEKRHAHEKSQEAIRHHIRINTRPPAEPKN